MLGKFLNRIDRFSSCITFPINSGVKTSCIFRPFSVLRSQSSHQSLKSRGDRVARSRLPPSRDVSLRSSGRRVPATRSEVPESAAATRRRAEQASLRADGRAPPAPGSLLVPRPWFDPSTGNLSFRHGVLTAPRRLCAPAARAAPFASSRASGGRDAASGSPATGWIALCPPCRPSVFFTSTARVLSTCLSLQRKPNAQARVTFRKEQ